MRIPVVLSSDERIFFSVAAVIVSMAEHAVEGTSYDVRVLCAGDVPEADRRRMCSIADRYQNVSVACIDMKDTYAAIRKTHDYVNHVSAYRMLIPELLPEYDRALYIDTDVIVRDDLSELFETDLDGAYIGGVVSLTNQTSRREAVAIQAELPEMDWYVNTGVLLMDLAAIRRDGIAEKWQAFLGKFEGSVDQHILNHVCRGRIAFLPLRYNVYLSALGLYTDGTAHVFASPKEVREAYENPAIFHFSLRTKPWDYYDLPLAHEWFRYFAKTPFFAPRDRKALHSHASAESRARPRPRGLAKIAYKVWKHLDKRYGAGRV